MISIKGEKQAAYRLHPHSIFALSKKLSAESSFIYIKVVFLQGWQYVT
jgi:hypothetical protein